MKAQGGSTGRLVQDSAYFVGLLRKKINDVNTESMRLRQEMDQQSRDNSQYVQLEKRYENLVKNKETLEGQLADYNLALDKVTTSPAAYFCAKKQTFLVPNLMAQIALFV